MRVLGVDFTSAPSRRKPITVADGRLDRDRVAIDRVDRLPDWPSFEALIRSPGPWVGAFDLPFGLSRELVEAFGWPAARSRTQRAYRETIAAFARLDRAQVGKRFARFRTRRPKGSKFARRATELAAGAHPSMRLVNPPVAWMLHEGVPRLIEAGLYLPGLSRGDRSRVALEAYPGLVMRRIAQARGERRAPSYKSDARAKQTRARRDARVDLLWALVEGAHDFAIRVDLPMGLAEVAIEDGTGDTLDAIACAMLAGWAGQRAEHHYGLPARIDPVEGWIVGAEK
ncbi:MAG TPA: DUF429 domain-containing protein [Casimicrobiaceae bacterium]|nr:DUF429 domain-containing protein [Casimicrobiaceae bacterium]